MPFNLATDVKEVVNADPPRLLFYGPAGVGKTSGAADFPDVIFLQTESGQPNGRTLKSFGKLNNYSEVMEAVGALAMQDHPYRWVALDSLSGLQPMVWDHTVKTEQISSVDGASFGKGYLLADKYWGKLMAGLNALRAKGMGIILIAHSVVEEFDDPMTQSYSRHEIDLHKRARGMIVKDQDAVLFINKSVSVVEDDVGFNAKRIRAEGSETVWMYATPRPTYNAKNRYDMPNKILYQAGGAFDAIAEYLPEQFQQ